MKQPLELISFKLCPFVQRSIILLEEKGVDYKITYIDLASKPEWFLKISPMGKVPVLKVGENILFESSVINEFIDEYVGESLHPNDLIKKAKHRAWIEFSSTMVFDLVKLLQASNETAFEEIYEQFRVKLRKLESEIDGEFFSTKFQLVDIAFAPILLRLQFVKNRVHTCLAEFPKLQKWSNNVLSRESVKKSFSSDLETIFINRFISQNSYFLGSEKKE
jgi:glutathione S-transferase